MTHAASMMNRPRDPFLAMLFFAHVLLLMLLLSTGCAWVKARETSAVACVEAALAGQVEKLIRQVAAGDYSALKSVSSAVLECAVAAAVQLPKVEGQLPPHIALQVELSIRKVR